MPRKLKKVYWFWAWLSVITVPKAKKDVEDTRGELWQNLVMISAESATEAVAAAIDLGRRDEGDCSGSLTLDGVPATSVFLGIEDMGLIHDQLEHGAEILFRSSRPRMQNARKRVKSIEYLCARVSEELQPYLKNQQ